MRIMKKAHSERELPKTHQGGGADSVVTAVKQPLFTDPHSVTAISKKTSSNDTMADQQT